MALKKGRGSVLITAYKGASEAAVRGAIDCLSCGLYIFLRRKS
jgi:hypothetical protein